MRENASVLAIFYETLRYETETRFPTKRDSVTTNRWSSEAVKLFTLTLLLEKHPSHLSLCHKLSVHRGWASDGCVTDVRDDCPKAGLT